MRRAGILSAMTARPLRGRGWGWLHGLLVAVLLLAAGPGRVACLMTAAAVPPCSSHAGTGLDHELTGSAHGGSAAAASLDDMSGSAAPLPARQPAQHDCAYCLFACHTATALLLTSFAVGDGGAPARSDAVAWRLHGTIVAPLPRPPNVV